MYFGSLSVRAMSLSLYRTLDVFSSGNEKVQRFGLRLTGVANLFRKLNWGCADRWEERSVRSRWGLIRSGAIALVVQAVFMVFSGILI